MSISMQSRRDLEQIDAASDAIGAQIYKISAAVRSMADRLGDGSPGDDPATMAAEMTRRRLILNQYGELLAADDLWDRMLARV